MTLLDALILGIIEGITEFLPVSSTGHLILASDLLGIPQTEAVKSFEISIQLGAIMAVVALYVRKIFSDFNLIKRVAIGFIPTAVFGFVLYKIVKQFLLGNSGVVIWSLIIGGILMIAIEYFYKKISRFSSPRRHLSYWQSALIGIFQSAAMVPGVSRSAATIMGGMLLGVSRVAITEFSFLLAVPTMAAATALDTWKSAYAFSFSDWHLLLVGFVTSFFVAMLSIKWLLKFIESHTFTAFGVYRIFIGIIFLLL